MKVNLEKKVNFCRWCGEVQIDVPLRCNHYEHHENVYIKDAEIDLYKCEQCGTLSSHWREIRLSLPWWVRYDIFNELEIPRYNEEDRPFVLRCPNCRAGIL